MYSMTGLGGAGVAGPLADLAALVAPGLPGVPGPLRLWGWRSGSRRRVQKGPELPRARLDPLAVRHLPDHASRVQETGHGSGADGSVVTGIPCRSKMPHLGS
jgi:hypothetical protein